MIIKHTIALFYGNSSPGRMPLNELLCKFLLKEFVTTVIEPVHGFAA